MSHVPRMLLGGVRTYARKFVGDGGVKYGLITYYPRTPDHVDPPIEPTKLLMVQRIKPFKGNPWWDKETLTNFRLDGKQGDKVIVKNIPEVTAKLWSIKHLIKVTPIHCPNGLPKDGDSNGTFLHENGTFMVNRKVKIDDKRIKATDEFLNNTKHLDKDTLIKEMRLRWLNPL